MAISRAYQALNMWDEPVWFGIVKEASPTRIDISLGSLRVLYEGSFTYGFFGDARGTLTSVTKWNTSGLHYEISGIDADMAAFSSAIQDLHSWFWAATIALASNDRLTGSAEDDKLFGWTGNDRIRGGGGDDLLDGGDGNDVLWGGAGDDYIIGDYYRFHKTGNDRLFGGAGKDRLDGGNDNDTLTGGRGKDTFVFSNGEDTVTDFTKRDVIDLQAVASIVNFRDLKNNHATPVGDDLLISDGNNNTILLLDTQMDDLRANDFLF